MEIIVFLLVIVLVFASGAGKKNRPVKKGAPPAAARPAARPAAKPARKQGLEEALKELRQVLEVDQAKQAAQPQSKPEVLRASQPVVRAAAAPAQGEPMLADEDCHGGSMEHTHAEGDSHLADEDCFGGSMEHTHAEGVSRVAQARRMAAIDAQGTPSDVLPQVIDATALRRAVVMAEVLGRPKGRRIGIRH